MKTTKLLIRFLLKVAANFWHYVVFSIVIGFVGYLGIWSFYNVPNLYNWMIAVIIVDLFCIAYVYYVMLTDSIYIIRTWKQR